MNVAIALAATRQQISPAEVETRRQALLEEKGGYLMGCFLNWIDVAEGHVELPIYQRLPHLYVPMGRVRVRKLAKVQKVKKSAQPTAATASNSNFSR
jgi:hypothetical protein